MHKKRGKARTKRECGWKVRERDDATIRWMKKRGEEVRGRKMRRWGVVIIGKGRGRGRG